MQSQQANIADSPTIQHSKSIHFAEGIPAFESVTDFVILAKEEEAPFMWLQALNEPNLAFIVVDPFVIHPDYKPDLLDEDAKTLKIKEPEDALLLAIVNVRNNPEQGITANLVGPLVVNWREKIGKQVILKNHLEYSVKHRID